MKNNLFPLFFTIERVENGYILTTKSESSGITQEPKYLKEIVTEDKIRNRIGELLHLDALKKEYPVVFHVEAVSESAYKQEDTYGKDELIEAKLAYAHFHSRTNAEDCFTALLIEDDNVIELYANDALSIAKANDLRIARIGGVAVLSFPNTKDGKKMLASCCPKANLIQAEKSTILSWYEQRKVILLQN